MTSYILFVLAFLICNYAILAGTYTRQHTYWQLRERLLVHEKRQSLGGELKLGPVEIMANYVLMAAKNKEINDGFKSGNNFLPARNFMEVIPEIEESKVFKILREMPKGAVLHCHDTAIVSLDYKFNNLTYRDNLYVCDLDGKLYLKFFAVPDQNCNWQLLSDVRQDPVHAESINDRIKREMSMVTENPTIAYNTVDKAWEKFNGIFKFIGPLLSYKPIYEEHFYQALQELYDDNVMYLEVRSTLPQLYDLDGKKYGPLDTVRVHKEVSERFVKDHPDFIGVKVIYSPVRSVNTEKLEDYLETLTELRKAYPNFVVGFDLVGQEDKGKPLTEFADKLNSVDRDVRFFFHAGETNWNGQSTDLNLFDAFLLNTKRIGHGYALTKHPLLWNFVKQLQIAVEICPISNQVLGLVQDMRNHPATSMFSSGSPIVISNDDPGLWGAKGLTYDFYQAFMALMSSNSDIRSLKQLAENSLIYSSLNNNEKRRALIQWRKKWNIFVAKLAQLQQI